MKTFYNFNTRDWEAGAARRVGRHDLIFNAPPCDPIKYGMPLGNGDIGALVWCENERLYIAVNKCDLWDDSETDDFSNWKLREEESSTVLRHGFRIVIDFGDPVFDEFYLSEFQARVSLADGLLTVRSVTPFGKVDFSAFVTQPGAGEDSVLCCSLNTELTEKQDIVLCAERYGSRSFPHWYSRVINDPASGLGGCGSDAEDGLLTLTQKLRSGTFAAGIRCGGDFKPERISSRRVRGKLPEQCVFYASVTSPSDTDVRTEIGAILGRAEKNGFDLLYRKSAASWEKFWMSSFIMTDNDFWDNLWALTMYCGRSSQGGRYPGRFIDGLWAPMRDFQAWAFYFHWNQQMVCWPLNAAGHHELCESYLNYRFDTLPKAVRTAEVYQKVGNGGAYVSDVCDRNGNNSLSELANHTPVAEIALDFYRQYKYTCDREFLVRKALPYMISAAKYMQTLFKKEEDGRYHAVCGTGYEGWILLRDSTSELACARALFRAVAEALEEAGQTAAEAGLWKDILADTAPYLTAVPDARFAADGLILQGPLKGEKCGGETIAAGYGIERKAVLAAKQLEGIFPTADKAPVFPSGDIGLGDEGSGLFGAAVNTARIYSEAGNGWDPAVITAARLGLGNDAARLFEKHVAKWLLSSNGFGHYTDSTDYNDRYMHNEVETFTPDFQPLGKRVRSEWPFRHVGLECTAVLSCALNETLLQSHDGTIRIFPAVRDGATARFTLHACGGFKVSAETDKGRILWAAVESLAGKRLTMQNPWKTICFVNGTGYAGKIVTLDTRKGEFYVFTAGADDAFETEPLPEQRNNDVKKHSSGRTIGREGFL